MEASKYILKNILPGETLIKVFASSKGFFGYSFDVAMTDKRVFGRMDTDKKAKGYSFPANKIKGIEIKPGGFFSGKSEVAVIGPYNHQLVFPSKDPEADRDFIIETLNLKL